MSSKMRKCCARYENNLDKCIRKSQFSKSKECVDEKAAVAACHGLRLDVRDQTCPTCVMSRCQNLCKGVIPSYTDSNGKTYKSCASFLSDFAACDKGWRWKLEDKDLKSSVL